MRTPEAPGLESPDLTKAARCLAGGGLVAFATETVYGLGADARSADAVAKIYAAKGRPVFNPLIAHVASLEMARREGVFSAAAERIAAEFWPGPLTLVLLRSPTGSVCDLACAGLANVGLRVPAHPLASALLDAVGIPIAAPSANRSGRLSPTRAADVAEDLGDAVDLILDGGDCPLGLESTIVACLDDRLMLLRPGAVPRSAIEDCTGRSVTHSASGILAPGMLTSHYAPRAGIRLDAEALQHGEVGLDFAGRLGGDGLDLSRSGDLREAAANLYHYLRQLDAGGAITIAVAPIPMSGIGAAINDRLRRAAAPRADDVSRWKS